jgi:hypothetical protein
MGRFRPQPKAKARRLLSDLEAPPDFAPGMEVLQAHPTAGASVSVLVPVGFAFCRIPLRVDAAKKSVRRWSYGDLQATAFRCSSRRSP